MLQKRSWTSRWTRSPPESNRVFCEFSGGIGEALIGALSALFLTIFWSEASLLSSWTSFNFVSPTAHFSFPFSAQLLNRLSDPRFPPFQCHRVWKSGSRMQSCSYLFVRRMFFRALDLINTASSRGDSGGDILAVVCFEGRTCMCGGAVLASGVSEIAQMRCHELCFHMALCCL